MTAAIDGCLNPPRGLGWDGVLPAFVAAEDQQLRHDDGLAIGERPAVVLNDLHIAAFATLEASFWMVAHGKKCLYVSKSFIVVIAYYILVMVSSHFNPFHLCQCSNTLLPCGVSL